MQVRIKKLVHGGAGVGDVDGKKIFIPFSAPGDFCEVEIDADCGGYFEGRLIHLIEESSDRVIPKCPVFGKCGGCQWQHITYDAQLRCKRDILIESLQRIAKISSPNVMETMPSPRQWHYRNRMQLHVDSKGRVGFYRAKSKEVVEFEECFIADARLNEKLRISRGEFSKRDRGVSLRIEDGPSFLQINSGQNDQLKSKLVEWLSESEHGEVLELYAGAGNFTFDMAKVAGHVIASEIDIKAVEIARAEIFKKGISNIDFYAEPSEKTEHRIQGKVDAIVVDPPRRGCEGALKGMIRLSPRHIYYISCNPATLSRDVATLMKNGYELVRAMPVDMFPQTFHVEAMVQLTLLRPLL
ncbi:MAG TPA: class I SAM-dependent RNA methyltransferase [bacterium]|nr:class I SAM-dependent RNA methyltransferase [bacterium]